LNLVVDIGNTRIKAALFRERELLQFFHFPDVDAFMSWLPSQHAEITHSVLGSVVEPVEPIVAALPGKMLVFKTNTPIPITNSYRSAATLGSDRLAGAIGAAAAQPGTDCLVVDAGTCVKYNLITASGEYLGGGISPGLQMRFRAMQHFTDRLPLVPFDESFDTLIGRDTRESILSGAIYGFLDEIDGMIDRYRVQFPGLRTVITGGDSGYLAKRLKNHIFADPYLILKGLNEVLIYNTAIENS